MLFLFNDIHVFVTILVEGQGKPNLLTIYDRECSGIWVMVQMFFDRSKI